MKPTNPEYGLSLKQPWAALLVSGRKTIEIRSWPTARRGRILIHAALVSDTRPEVWKHVPKSILPLAHLTGGIIGAADLIACKVYRTLADFRRDQAHHLNEPDWFQTPVMYGFSFAHPVILPFRPYSGWMRFFPIQPEEQA